MADNVTTPATGAGDTTPKVATEQVSGTLEHKQLVELAIPGTGRTLVPATTANGLLVDVSRTQLPTAGGVSLHHRVATADTNAVNIKASAGQVYGWNIFNNSLYAIYVKFHNTAGTPTAGTGVVHTIGVQAGVNLPGQIPVGLPFATGIAMTIVKDITDAGATAVALSDCVVDIYFK